MLTGRGAVAVQKLIDVTLDNGDVIQETGYFNPITDEILSHKKPSNNNGNGDSTPTAGQYEL